MKKIFILFLFLFSYTLSPAQITDKHENTPSARHPTTNADKMLQNLQSPYRGLNSPQIKTGILYDNIISSAKIEDYSGITPLKPASKSLLKQVYLELMTARVIPTKFKSFAQLESAYRTNEKVIPISILHYKYDQVKADAFAKGLLQNKNGKIIQSKIPTESPYQVKRAFVAAALREYTFRGNKITFRLNPDLYLTNENEKLIRVKIDFGDNRGFREINFNQDIVVHYSTISTKTISVAAITAEQDTLQSFFQLEVKALTSPDHVDIGVQADIPYQGVYASGTAFVYQSPRNAQVTNPIFLLEGFDLDNSRYADELYNVINQQNLADSLREQGYDIIIINFTDATTYIQANAMMVVKLMDYINNQLKAGNNPNIVVGASMGGVVARYALSFIEKNNLNSHETGLFISFDSPQQGANIPLGDQYLIRYFAINPISPNAEARESLMALNTIAAQQQLVYHHISQPDELSPPLPNNYRLNLVSDLAAIGYPQNCRNIAIANGAGTGTGQPFEPGALLIKYYYKSFFRVDIDIRSYALPLLQPATILYFSIDPFINFTGPQRFKVEKKIMATAPYDNAPGSTSSTSRDIAAREVKYGDIQALIEAHCFIPTISSLDIKTYEPVAGDSYDADLLRQNLFYSIQADPDILRKTPFQAIYYPTLPTPEFPNINQAHVAITNETVGWIRQELDLLNRPAYGAVSREIWLNIPGSNISDIPVDLPATVTDLPSRLETPANQGDDYGERLRGYLQAPQTGEYTFWLAADDAAELWLSEEEQPATKRKIAFLTGWTYEREWNRYDTQKAMAVLLEAGKKYYLEVLHKESFGNDHLAVSWRTPAHEANSLPEVVPGAVLSPYVNPIANARLAVKATAIEKSNFPFLVYPNPASGQATVAFTAPETGKLGVQVFDLQGRAHQKIFSGEVKAGSFLQRPLDVSSLSSGVYLLRMVNEKKVQHLKLLVTH